MKLPFSCFACLDEFETAGIPSLTMLAPTDDGRYNACCARGHSTLVVLQEDRFQLLFQIGIHALVDGYPREAVADFTAALERFYEFYYRFFCRVFNIKRDAQDQTWAHVAQQSERQLGLFLASYLALNHQPGPTLPRAQTEFRNKVVHKGTIPTYDKALEFGRSAADLVQPIMSTISRTHSEIIQAMDFERIVQASANDRGSTMSYPTFLRFGEQEMSLEAVVASARLPPWSYRG